MTHLRRAAFGLLLLNLTLQAVTILEIARMVDLADHGESPLAAFVARWLVERPGPGWFGLPWTVMPYGPLMPLAWRTVAVILPDVSLLMIGRGIALASAAGLMTVTWRMVRRETQSAIAGLAAVALFLGSTIGESWLPRGRVDIVAALFVACAYARTATSRSFSTWPGVWLVIASLAKQTAILHAVPLAWIYWRKHGRRETGRLLLVFAGLAALTWSIVALSPNGFFFSASVATLVGRQIHVSQYVPYVQTWVTSPSGVAMLVAALWMATVRPAEALDSPWWCGFVWAFVFGSATSVSEGASINYMLDATWLGAILVGLAFSRLELWRSPLAYGVAAGAVLLWAPTFVLRHYPNGKLQPPGNHRAALVAQLTAARPVVLADGDLVGYLAPGAVPLINDPFLFRLFDDRRRAPTEELLVALESPAAMVLLSQPLIVHERSLHHWPSAVIARLRQDFCIESWREGVLVYRRRTAVTSCMAEP